ncbi:biosynthetic-type acetolactate synthase large subunit [Clostridium beijerinckii]|jgi:acetolactate synthase-1/2/3 large subunit|uniref:Acetolactate synthase n=2 Tax=Clostridium beijerinckii TaxID=1520 RepID=A0AAW3W3W9_CLOBE|nr:biosynthetic-type acetolactate synthase large subunit [Clostridium beijerinckii]MBC2456052.1 biosynthetic-type acetolactate synthase large subunit [Clostridium beijerinckii]MBC2473600.1 biosynthetic-type acetolactate synthase large subunit [Clostridium beijerinckii]MCI1478168.1 biosynthetic-type acetolactate synthase large subunit [Clostridium beijerinckii]MCI1578531.1 biosynthetic-type acetolactate synthase large subunit [Clostridium beijerinckii]MCI1584238.1 biosynthetic-type acetolactate
MLLTGAEILIKSLLDEGVETIFGYPGGAVLNIYDELYKYKDKIRHVLTCHEQGASHAADGYARATGKVGVCLATSGPGATNLVTGIATAYMDSIPMVAITGNVAKPLLGKDSFQEVDITGITMPITKHNYIVRDINELQDIIREAFYIAKEGRPGPVLIDIPKDITAEKTQYNKIIPKEIVRKSEHITEKSLQEAVELINQSKRPLIYAGGGIGISGATSELTKFAEKINCPVSTSLMCMAEFPNDHELYTGMIGMHGTKASNIAATKCDLLITLGARFSDRVISNQNHIKNAKILQIDVDPAEINKNIKVDTCIVGDLKVALNQLIPIIEEKKNDEWLNTINNLKENNKLVTYCDLTPELFFDRLNKLNDGSFIISTEVGQHQMWTAQYFNFKSERTFITSGGLGTMGYGLGAAIGAQIGRLDKRVFNIAGDGSFGMNCNELVTAVKNNLPLIQVIMNNNCLGMVRQWQDFFYEGRYSETTLDRPTDYVKLAEAFGAKAFRITQVDEIDDILRKALDSEGPVLIDYLINSDKKVFPMVAPGAPINQIISEEDININ